MGLIATLTSAGKLLQLVRDQLVQNVVEAARDLPTRIMLAKLLHVADIADVIAFAWVVEDLVAEAFARARLECVNRFNIEMEFRRVPPKL